MKKTDREGTKLHLGHFAFVRSIVQGLDVRESWIRCFGPEDAQADTRTIRAQIAKIRDALSAAARREGRYGTARLVLVDPASIAESDVALPSLEEFAGVRGLADFSEQEQVAAYEAEYGRATQGARRRARLIARQLDAIRWLESLVSKPPHPGDPVDAWLNPAQAARLRDSGLPTLGDLIRHIERVGPHWYRGIGSLGVAKADRIVAWLAAHAESLGVSWDTDAPPGSSSDRTEGAMHVWQRPNAESSVRDPSMDRHGSPAMTPPTSDPDSKPQPAEPVMPGDDRTAVDEWLASKGWASGGHVTIELAAGGQDTLARAQTDGQTHTSRRPTLTHAERAYRREAERFLLWCAIERSKTLATVDPQDCLAYQQFLSDPQPRSRWCGDRSGAKGTDRWRPFEGPLSPGAQRQATTILRNLFRFLAEHGHRTGNPWARLPAAYAANPRVDADRSFSLSQWRFIADELDRRSSTATQERLRLGLRWLHATGARLSELMDARLADLAALPDQGTVWTIGRGGRRVREVPVPDSLLHDLGRHLQRRGLPADPLSPLHGDAHLIGKVSVRSHGDGPLLEGIAPTTFHSQVKAFFKHCGRVLRAQGHEQEAVRFEAASAHWLRHSHARHALLAGVPIEVAQRHLGHASLSTTALYADRPATRPIDAMKGFWSMHAGPPPGNNKEASDSLVQTQHMEADGVAIVPVQVSTLDALTSTARTPHPATRPRRP